MAIEEIDGPRTYVIAVYYIVATIATAGFGDVVAVHISSLQ